jgi:hypothetical protein
LCQSAGTLRGSWRLLCNKTIRIVEIVNQFCAEFEVSSCIGRMGGLGAVSVEPAGLAIGEYSEQAARRKAGRSPPLAVRSSLRKI